MRRMKSINIMLCLIYGWFSPVMAATIQGVVIHEQDKPLPLEVVLIAEELDYIDYQFFQGKTFSLVNVPIGSYMIYVRNGTSLKDSDRLESVEHIEIQEEKIYKVEIRLAPPYWLKESSIPMIQKNKKD